MDLLARARAPQRNGDAEGPLVPRLQLVARNVSDFLYRYDIHRYSLGVDEFDEPLGCRTEVVLDKFPIVKRTPKGTWIDTYYGRKFVLLTARKQFACETQELARESFIRRKTRYIEYLKHRLRETELAIARARAMR